MRPFAILFVLAAGAVSAGPAAFHVNYATYLGGGLDEQAAGIAVDSAGNAYIVGTTSSPDFPLTSTAFGAPSKDNACAFVAKLSATGGALVWSICLANSTGAAIALDASGNVYVLTGATITKLTPAADKIVYSKPLGTVAAEMAVDLMLSTV